jgi:hypothetical protein
MTKNEAVAHAFLQRHKGTGHFSDELLEANYRALASSGNEHVDCKANVISALFYVNLMINVYDDTHTKFVEKFDGNAGGIAFPGDSYFEVCTLTACDGYTIADVYAKTKSFECTAASIAVSAVFFDKDHKTIAHMEGAGAGSVIGEFAGTGHWSTF